jgi:hypothetical protein
MENLTESELSKLHRDIIDEGINKKNYSDSEENSDDELVMKFVQPRGKNSNHFETTGYAFALNNKMSKFRSEMARLEERMRYLQLDYNNCQVKLDEQKLVLVSMKTKYAFSVSENKNLAKKNSRYLFILFGSLSLNCLFFLTALNNAYFPARVVYT